MAVGTRVDEKESLLQIDLEDGGKIIYPRYFIGSDTGSGTPARIEMRPLTAGVEEKAFALIARLFDEMPELDLLIATAGSSTSSFRDALAQVNVVETIRKAVERIPSILIDIADALTTATADEIREQLTMADLVRLITPAIFLEKYRFQQATGDILEELGFNLDEIDNPEPQTVDEALTENDSD